MRDEIMETFREIKRMLQDVEMPNTPVWFRADEGRLKPLRAPEPGDDVDALREEAARKLDDLLGRLYSLVSRAHVRVMHYALRHAGEQVTASYIFDFLRAKDAIFEIRRRVTEEGLVFGVSEVYEKLKVLRTALDGILGAVEEVCELEQREEKERQRG